LLSAERDTLRGNYFWGGKRYSEMKVG